MSKSSKSLKNSKAGKRQVQAKSAKKSAEKALEKRLEEAATPVPLSLKKENYGKHLTDLAQLAVGGLGFFCLGFVIAYVFLSIRDFVVDGVEFGESFAEYINTCEPVAACRVADISELIVIIFFAVAGILCLKMALTNRHSKRRTVRSLLAMIIIACLFYVVDFVLNKIFWQS